MNWYDTKQHIRECVLADIELGDLRQKAQTRIIGKIIWLQDERVVIPVLEFIPDGWVSEDDIYDYAHEFADSASWVIYHGQSRELWIDSEDVRNYWAVVDDMYDNTSRSIDSLISVCVYEATREAVLEVIRSLQEDMADA